MAQRRVASPSKDQHEVGYPRKRARTRRRLIIAGMAVLARRGPDGATVGEIAGEAGVASGTFYNHFPTLMDLVESISAELGQGVEIASATLDSIDNDPAARVVVGAVQLLSLVEQDKISAAAFVSLLATIPTFRGHIRSIVQRTIEAGVDADRFHVPDVVAATDAILGAITQWIRSDLVGESQKVDPASRANLLMRLLGVDPASIDGVVSRAQEAMVKTR